MPYRQQITTKTYLFNKIEKDILEDFLMKENLENSLKTGTNKYTWQWITETNDDIGDYSSLMISMFEIDPSTRRATATPFMKIVPVDKFDRIVQTSAQRKKYADRVARTQKMLAKMEQQGIKLQTERAIKEKVPDFAPESDPEFIATAKGLE